MKKRRRRVGFGSQSQNRFYRLIDSLVAVVTGPGGRPVAGKLLEEASFGAEDVSGSLFLEGRLAAQHGLPAGRADDLSCGRRSPVLVVRDGRCRGQRPLAVVTVKNTQRLTADWWTNGAQRWRRW